MAPSRLSDLGNKAHEKLTKLKTQLQETVQTIQNHVKDLKKKNQDLLVEVLRSVAEKFQQLISAVDNKLGSKTVNYGVVEDVSNLLKEKADEAKTKLSEVSKILQDKAVEVETKAKEELEKVLDEANKQVDHAKVVGQESEEKVLEAGNKVDEKVLQVKEKLHQLLDTLHDKYLQLREKSKNWSERFAEKRQDMLNKVKGMIQRVRERLSGKKSEENSRSKRSVSESVNYGIIRDAVANQAGRLKETIQKLEDRLAGSDGFVKEGLARKLAALRSLLERLESRLKDTSTDGTTSYGIEDTLKFEIENLKERIERMEEIERGAIGVVKERIASQLGALRSLVERLENRLRESSVAFYGTIQDAVGDSDEANKMTEDADKMLHDIVNAVKVDSNAKFDELIEHVHKVFKELKELKPKESKREKRSLSDLGRRIDERLKTLRENLKFENIGKRVEARVETVKNVLEKAVKKVSDVTKDVKDVAVEAVQTQVDVAKGLVDQILQTARNIN